MFLDKTTRQSIRCHSGSSRQVGPSAHRNSIGLRVVFVSNHTRSTLFLDETLPFCDFVLPLPFLCRTLLTSPWMVRCCLGSPRQAPRTRRNRAGVPGMLLQVRLVSTWLTSYVPESPLLTMECRPSTAESFAPFEEFVHKLTTKFLYSGQHMESLVKRLATLDVPNTSAICTRVSHQQPESASDSVSWPPINISVPGHQPLGQSM